MSRRTSICAAAIALACTAAVAGAQAASAAKHPPVCAAGVRVYHDRADVPAPHDTLSLPSGPQLRVTNPEEAEAAELATRERAGAVGATGILVSDEDVETPDGIRRHRTVTAVYVPADSAHATAACKKS
ncbi:MAG TPA: hypothetical protein VGM82_17795 [Gemmatimonadaceae bacterium]|jgi:hypothetical protein